MQYESRLREFHMCILFLNCYFFLQGTDWSQHVCAWGRCIWWASVFTCSGLFHCPFTV